MFSDGRRETDIVTTWRDFLARRYFLARPGDLGKAAGPAGDPDFVCSTPLKIIARRI